jgi:uncharacterized protein (TIGR03437 family)
MSRFVRSGIIGIVVAVSAVWAQPRLRPENPVVNGASYSNRIAPGSIFVVFGTDLAGEGLVQAPRLPLETRLGDVSIRFTPVAGGPAIDALMVYTTRNQIAGLLPSTAAPGEYNVTVTYRGQTSAPGRARVVARSLGIVSADASGTGQAQAQIYYTATQWSLNRFTSGQLGRFSTAVAHPGDTLVLWGTGLGADAASDLNGGTSGDRTGAARVRIRVGNVEHTPAYAGRAGGLPGTDQFNFTLAGDVPTGCFVPVQIVVEGGSSNVVTLAIAPRGQSACSHPFLGEAELRRLSEGGTVTVGDFTLSRSTTEMTLPGVGSFEMTSENLVGGFARFTVGNLGALANYPGLVTLQIGQCYIARLQSTQTDFGEFGLFFDPIKDLDAGSPLRLNGPNASNVAVPWDSKTGSYSLVLYNSGFPGLPGSGSGQPTIAPGEYILAGTGGRDVGAFTARVRVPAVFNWTNRAAITSVTRAEGISVTWTGGEGSVSIVGYSANRVGGTPADPIMEFGLFVCEQRAAEGRFTVPASVLNLLPPSLSQEGVSVGMLSLSNEGCERFTAPLVAGGRTDHAEFCYAFSSGKLLDYR